MYTAYSDDKSFNAAAAELTKEMIDNPLVVKHTSEAYTRFKDIESNVSVRDGFTRYDYDYFREGERIPTLKKNIIRAARKAYEKIGLIRNIIDLMGDFTCQGIRIVHENPAVEDFYKAWFKKIDGKERSERFANLLYREANVIVKRDTAKLRLGDVRNLRESIGAELSVEPEVSLENREVPWRYTFLSPLQVESVGNEIVAFSGKTNYRIKLSSNLLRIIKSPKNSSEKDLVNSLPKDILEAAKTGVLNLDPKKTKAYFYKKDDWDVWATPMIYPIMDDLVLLEKLKLADTTALDGAISFIRVWKLGSIEQKILPTNAAIKKLRDILLQNTGGGNMDLVWGPELTLEETSTDISKFLGIKKYEPTMMNIFQGLGIPPSLSGSVSAGGFTNNVVSLKTLVERLNYGRTILTKFWDEEIRIVQRAMGFAKPAQILYDHMVLSDESAFLTLLVQLADRNIISEDALRERFGEISNIERAKIKKDFSDRKKSAIPPKASPYHTPNLDADLRKLAIQKGYTPSQVGLELEENQDEPGPNLPTGNKENKNYGVGQPGRPKNSRDTSKRSRTPKGVGMGESEDVMRTMLWAQKAYAQISEIVLPHILKAMGCKNVRSMTEKQFAQFEQIKFATLCQFEPHENITPDKLVDILANSPKIDNEVKTVYNSLVEPIKEPTIEMLRNAQCLAYAVIK